MKIILFILLFIPLHFFGQTDTNVKKNTYVGSYFTDCKDIALSPLHWKSKQWITAGSVLGATFLVHLYDNDINNYFQKRQTNLGENISKYGLEPWGSGLYSMSAMLLLYTQGHLWKNNRSKKVALLGVKAYLISGLFIQIPKFLINRHRPYHDTPSNPNIFVGPSSDLFLSFASGHTTSIFAVATVIAEEYASTLWVPIVSYSLASLTGISRMYDNKHWASDVFFGAALGWSIGKLIQKSKHWNIQVSPYINQESTGMLIQYSL